jgi:hypothetical protein
MESVMAAAKLDWKTLPTDGMPKPIATAYEKYKTSHEELRVAIEKHFAKKNELDLDTQQVVIATRRGLGYAVKTRGSGSSEGEW